MLTPLDTSRSHLYDLTATGTGDKLKSVLAWNRKESIDMIRLDGRKRKYNPYGLVEHVGQTLLHVASFHGNASCVEALLDLGADPTERTPLETEYFDIDCSHEHETDVGWETSMHLAAASGSGSVVSLLRRAGADINALAANQTTPLMTAADRFTRKRLRKRAPPTTEGVTKLLDDAAVLRQVESEAVWALLAAGADLDARSGEVNRNNMHHKMTPHSRDVEKQGLHARVTKDLTALHWAINAGDKGVAHSLIIAGADLEAKTSADSVCDKEQTPLHFAVEFLDIEIVKLLLAAGADVNVKDALGNTPLRKVFAVSDDTYKRWCHWRDLDLTETTSEVKRDRLVITKMLIQAGASDESKADFAEYINRVTHEKEEEPDDRSSRHRRHHHYYHPFHDHHRHYRHNQPVEEIDSGGDALVDLLATTDIDPHSLQSICRWMIRKALTRPILRDGNVDTLPLPGKLKSYVAMMILDLKDC